MLTISTFFLLSGPVTPAYVHAETMRPQVNTTINASSSALKTKVVSNLGNKETNLKERANTEIDRRITSLTELLVRVNGLKLVSVFFYFL